MTSVTIAVTKHAADAYEIADDGGLCGANEIVSSHDEAHAAAEQRMRVYCLRGMAVAPWTVPL